MELVMGSQPIKATISLPTGGVRLQESTRIFKCSKIVVGAPRESILRKTSPMQTQDKKCMWSTKSLKTVGHISSRALIEGKSIKGGHSGTGKNPPLSKVTPLRNEVKHPARNLTPTRWSWIHSNKSKPNSSKMLSLSILLSLCQRSHLWFPR